MKVPVVETKDFIIYLEHYKDLVWLHTDVHKWTPKIKKCFVDIINHIQDTIGTDLFGLVDNDKLGKFGKSVGFSFYKTVLGYDKNEYKVFIRRYHNG